jgi:hypothetical protein
MSIVLFPTGNLDHKMWCAVPMTELVMHCDIRPYKKSVHLLVVSYVKKIFFAEFRKTSPPRLFSQCVMTEYIHSHTLRAIIIADGWIRIH